MDTVTYLQMPLPGGYVKARVSGMAPPVWKGDVQSRKVYYLAVIEHEHSGRRNRVALSTSKQDIYDALSKITSGSDQFYRSTDGDFLVIYANGKWLPIYYILCRKEIGPFITEWTTREIDPDGAYRVQREVPE